MKKTLLYIAALLAMVSCSESEYDDSRIASLEGRYLFVSANAVSFDVTESTKTISIESNAQWTATVQEGSGWLSVSQGQGTGKSDIQIKAVGNNTAEERAGKIAITIPDFKTYIIDVTQNRRYIKTNQSSVDFQPAGGQISFKVTTDWTYEVSKVGTWFGFIKNNDVITVVAQENTTGEDRTGAIILTLTGLEGGKVSLMVPVNQGKSQSSSKVKRIVRL